MTAIVSYLTFDGNCREAMEFYKSCLGGELNMHSFEAMPGSENMPEELRKRTMHANLVKGALVLMASDSNDLNQSLTKGNTITLSLNCSSDEEITEFFSKLADGGTVTMPLADQFWGAKFGMLTDKYGFDWMLNYDKVPHQ